MTRVLDALKALERRHQEEAPPALRPAAPPRAQVAPPKPQAAPAPIAPRPTPRTSVEQSPIGRAMEPAKLEARAHAVAHMCLLPTVPVVADHYHELAERVGEQLSTNYCNVMLLVSPDAATTDGFSMTHLAQAFSLQSSGDVLLVDGDLQRGQLSQSVNPKGPGIAEAMLGTARWPEIIHSTTTPRIDFVSRGDAKAPVAEPEDFGWGALRPKYRAVLIGISDTAAPETAWLAAHADAVYVLVSRPTTQRDTAVEAVEALRAGGANLMGCIVVND